MVQCGLLANRMILCMYYCRYQEYIIAVMYVVSTTLPKFMPHQEQSKALSYGVLVIIILPSQLSYLNNFIYWVSEDLYVLGVLCIHVPLISHLVYY